MSFREWSLGAAAICFIFGCASRQAKPVGQLVRDIQADEVRVQAELHGQRIEILGELMRKRVEERDKVEIEGEMGLLSDMEGRTVKQNVVIAVVADGANTAECELTERGTDQIKDVPLGTRIRLQGTLQSWSKGEQGIVPKLDRCFVRQVSERN